MALTPQIPFDFFEAEAPGFDNFVVGANAEVLARLRAVAADPGGLRMLALWGGPGVGKSHLLRAVATAAGASALLLGADATFPADPFVAAKLLCVDDADRLDDARQSWLFTAFNHVAQAGGITVATGSTAPSQWPLRDDLRTRMGSGLIHEVQPLPQDSLPAALAAYARARGFALSNEVLTYILSYSRRDIASLCQTLAGLDRLSLAGKRGVTIPLVREYLHRHFGDSTTG